MALAARSAASWRPLAVASAAASGLLVVFLRLPWGNASFLMAIVTLFAWIAAVAVRLATHHAEAPHVLLWPVNATLSLHTMAPRIRCIASRLRRDCRPTRLKESG